MADNPGGRRVPRLAHAYAVPALLALILLVALWLRLFGPSGHAFDWGDGQFVHPDEGFVGGTLVHNLTFPASIGDLFNADSGWNPAVAASLPQLTPTGHPVHGSNGFNYGSLPLYLIKIFAALLSWLGGIFPWWTRWKGIDQAPILAGRVLSALFDTATVFLVYLIGTRLAGRWSGLYAASLACVAVLPIQLAHFTTVDTMLTTFATGTVLASIDLLTHGSRRHYAVAGIWLAAALATKVSAVPLVTLVALAHLWRVGRDGQIDPWQALLSPRYLWERALRRGLLAPAALAGALTAIATFGVALFVFQPYTFSDWSTFWSGVSYQSDLASGRQLIFYTLKWHGTAPITYPLEQLTRYSLGLPLAALAYAGLAYAALRMLTPWRNASFLVAFFATATFVANGLLYMKYLRYMAPIVPSLCVLAALLVSALVRNRAAPLRLVGFGCGALVLTLTGGYALAYQHIYAVPLTRVQASCWMASSLPTGSTIAQDAPDESLPLAVCGAGARAFRPVGMPILLLYEDESRDKAAQMAAVLTQADYYVISSRRAIETFWDYGSKYPYTRRFYRILLGDGKGVRDPLGFRLVASFAEHPQLGPWVFQDYGANQNFNEYDHPPVWIFRNTGHLSAAALTAVLTDNGRIADPSTAPPAQAIPPKSLLLSPAQLAANGRSATYARMFPPDSLPMRLPAPVWLLMIEALGLLTLPLAMRLFGRLADHGFVLAKTVGILLLSWFAWILPSLGLTEYGRSEIALCLLPVAALSLGWGVRPWEIPTLLRARLGPVLIAEAVFLLGFLAWVWVRMLYPDLWHPFDGGEKTMDFSFLNAIVRSRAMPPYDPWFSGGYLNYYYYGHFTVATLLKLAGIAPTTAVNLAIPTFFALALSSCVALGYTLARRAGVALLAAAMALLGGNLYGAEQLIDNLQALSPDQPGLHPAVAAANGTPLLGGIAGLIAYGWSWLDGAVRGTGAVLSGLIQVAFHHATPPAYGFRNWAWAGSRVIDNHQIITEFPFFTFLYGDPHAHLWDIPFVLCAIALAMNLALAPILRRRDPRAAGPVGASPALLPGAGLVMWAVIGVLLGAVGPTNPWDLATMVAIFALALAARSFRLGADWPRMLLAVGGRLGVLLACALLAYAPFYLHFQSFYSHLGWTLLRHQTPLSDFLTHFGLPIFVLASYLSHGVLTRTNTGTWLRTRARALEFTLYYWERRALLPRYFALVRGQPHLPATWRGYQRQPRQALTIALLGLVLIAAAVALKIWLLAALLVLVIYALLVAGPVPALLLIGGGMVLLFLAIDYQVLALLSGMLAMTLLLMVDRKREEVGDDRALAEELFLHALIAVGLLVAAAGEIVYVRDFYDYDPLLFRTNTIFKLYEDAWLLLNIGAAVAIWRLLGPFLRPGNPRGRAEGTRRGGRRGWGYIWLGITALLFVAVAISPIRMLPERLDQRATAWPALAKAKIPPTLDGSAFLRVAYPGEYRAIAWIQAHIPGTPAILQSRYGNYGNFSGRVTMFTGMPSVVNWGFEAAQQRYNLQNAGGGRIYPEQVGLRERNVVDTIYSTTDRRQTLSLLRRYSVGYVYIGTQERGDPALATNRTAFHGFPAQGLAKFPRMAADGSLILVYNQAGIQIYQVPARGTRGGG